jgi:hypothetical protein
MGEKIALTFFFLVYVFFIYIAFKISVLIGACALIVAMPFIIVYLGAMGVFEWID